MRTALIVVALLALQDEKGIKTWSGTVNVAALESLPAGTIRGGAGVPLSAGCFQGGEGWKAFAKAADAGLAEKPEFDWSKRGVAVVVLHECTNRLKFVSWTAPKDGVAELRFDWSKIEIGLVDVVPALVHPFDLEGVREVKVIYTVDGKGDPKELGTIKMGA